MNTMKTKHLFLFSVIGAFLMACTYNPTTSDQLIGTWTTKSVTINGTDIEDINNGNLPSHILNFKSDYTYYRTYVTGTWSCVNNDLTLIPELEGEGIWHMEILDVNAAELTVKTYRTDIEYGVNLDDYDENEVLEIIEVYSWQE